MITVVDRVMYADTSKNEATWCRVLSHYDAEYDSILRIRSRDGGTEGTLYITAFNRWNDERNVNVNRNDNDWNDNWWFAGLRYSLHFPAPSFI